MTYTASPKISARDLSGEVAVAVKTRKIFVLGQEDARGLSHQVEISTFWDGDKIVFRTSTGQVFIAPVTEVTSVIAETTLLDYGVKA